MYEEFALKSCVIYGKCSLYIHGELRALRSNGIESATNSRPATTFSVSPRWSKSAIYYRQQCEGALVWTWLIWWNSDSVLQEAYSWLMVTVTGWYLTKLPMHCGHFWSIVSPHLSSNHSCVIHRSSLEKYQQRHLVAKQGETWPEMSVNFAVKS
jgi:hypothetical protein